MKPYLVRCHDFQVFPLCCSYYLATQSTFATVLTFLPSVVYAIVIVVMNILYRMLARFLNDWGTCTLQRFLHVGNGVHSS